MGTFRPGRNRLMSLCLRGDSVQINLKTFGRLIGRTMSAPNTINQQRLCLNKSACLNKTTLRENEEGAVEPDEAVPEQSRAAPKGTSYNEQ